jgi:hypothetical protein
MATNNIVTSGTGTTTILTQKYTADFTGNWNVSGSASLGQTFLVNVGPAWGAVDTGSVVNPGKIYLDNSAGPGIVQFATSSNATQSIATLYPSEWSWLSITASNVSNGTFPLYARAVDSASYVAVQIFPR